LSVRSYTYLGILFSDTGSFLPHIRQKVLPVVEGRLRGAASTVVNHDALNPELALQVLDMDVLSYIRSTIAVWGTSIWCPDQPNSLREALADLGELFFPVLAGILSVPRLAPYSKRCLRRELGWLGYEEVLIQSQLQLLRTMLCMPYDRLPKQLLLLRLSRLAPQTTSPPPVPPNLLLGAGSALTTPVRLHDATARKHPGSRSSNAKGPSPSTADKPPDRTHSSTSAHSHHPHQQHRSGTLQMGRSPVRPSARGAGYTSV